MKHSNLKAQFNIFLITIKRIMTSFNIEFAVHCETKFGERVCICGNLPELGNWNPTYGVILETDPQKYPLWTSQLPLRIKEGQKVEFKLSIIGDKCEVIRWEEIHGNRIFTPRRALIIELSESDASMIYKTPRVYSEVTLDVQNLRKGTDQVLDELASDSSSNRDMWKEHQYIDEQEGSLLLTQFTKQLAQSVSQQREESSSSSQLQPEMQLHHQLDFGTYHNHNYRIHYVFANGQATQNLAFLEPTRERVVLINFQSLKTLQLWHKEQVSLFHIIGYEKSDLVTIVKELMKRWTHISGGNLRGLVCVYLDESIQNHIFEELMKIGISVFIASSPLILNEILETFKGLNYRSYCKERDVFVGTKDRGEQIKVIYVPFTRKQFAANIVDRIEGLKDKILSGFYFSYGQKQFLSRLREKLGIWRLNKSQCLIILHVNKLEQLEDKSILDLVHLSSQKYKVIVFVIANERFPGNIQHKIPVQKHKVIFLNTHGELYANSSQPIDIFRYLQINKLKFEQNQNIVHEKLGVGVSKSYRRNSKLIIEFNNNNIGQLLKRMIVRLVRDANNKSTAKIIADIKQQKVQLAPFCLHLSYLYKVVLSTFASRLRVNEKAMVINVDGTDLQSLKYLNIPEGPEISLKFLRFCLRNKERRPNYSCNPMTESQLQGLVELLSQEWLSSNSKIQKASQSAFNDIKNIC